MISARLNEKMPEFLGENRIVREKDKDHDNIWTENAMLF